MDPKVAKGPDRQPARIRRRVAAGAVFGLTTLVLVFPAYWQMFSQFASHDDEGYLLGTLRGFVDGERLYRDVFSQYGPFYYELFGGLFNATGWQIGVNSGRLISLVIWVGSAATLGAAAWRLTRRLWAALAAEIVAFHLLYVLTNEPMHPLGLTSALLAAVTAAVVFVVPKKPALGMAAAGALGAALALTKVNTGAFVLIALAAACAAVAPPAGRPLGRLLSPLAVAAVVLAPAVMLPDISRAWAQIFSLVVVAGTAAVLLVSFRSSHSHHDSPPATALLGLVIGAAAATVVIIAAIVPFGVPLGAVLTKVFVEPMNQRFVLLIALPLDPRAAGWAFASLGLAAAARVFPHWLSSDGLWGAAVRIGAGLFMLSGLTLGLLGFGLLPNYDLAIPAAFAWLAAVPPGASQVSRTELLVRVSVCLMAVLQTLQAYPVAGTQYGVAALLLVLPATVCLADGLRQVEGVLGRNIVGARAPSVVRMAGALLVGTLAFEFGLRAGSEDRFKYLSNRPVPFATANRLRLPAEQVRTYTDVVSALRSRCRRFFTWPGMNTFHEWSGIPPATWHQPTVWTRLLDDGQQRRVVQDLETNDVPCVLRNSALQKDFWDTKGKSVEGPLTRYIQQRYVSATDLGGGYELLVAADSS